MSEENKCERCGATRWGSVGDMQKAVKAHNERCEGLKREGFLKGMDAAYWIIDSLNGEGDYDSVLEVLKKAVEVLKSRAGKEGEK